MGMKTIYDNIRKAIKASEKSRYRLSRESGISQPQLCDFMKGTKGFSVESLERLLPCLDLMMVLKPIERARTKKKGK